MLELPGRIQEVVCIRLGGELPHIRLLNEIFITLLLRKFDSILLALEVQVCTLHIVAGRLPPHQGVLPPVALWQHVPVHSPLLGLPVTRLCSGFSLLIDANRTGLQLDWCAGQYSGGKDDARLGAVEQALGHGSECADGRG